METSFVIRNTILLTLLLGGIASANAQDLPTKGRITKITVETEINGERVVTEHRIDSTTHAPFIFLNRAGRLDSIAGAALKERSFRVYKPDSASRYVLIDSLLGKKSYAHIQSQITPYTSVWPDSLTVLNLSKEGVSLHQQVQHVFLKDGKALKTSGDTIHIDSLTANGGKRIIIVYNGKLVSSGTGALAETAGSKAADINPNAFAGTAMQIYPNPTAGIFTIQLAAPGKGNAVLTISNTAGKEVYKEKLRNFSGTYQKELNLEHLPKGMYVARLQQGGKSVQQKLIIQ
jgi:hypothetical protein